MLVDPISAMSNVETTMAEYIKNVSDYDASFRQYKQRLDEERQKRAQVFKDKGADEAAKYEQEVTTPLALQAGYLQLNVRYYALAAPPPGDSWREGCTFFEGEIHYQSVGLDMDKFTSRLNAVLPSFENSIVPQLVPVDI